MRGCFKYTINNGVWCLLCRARWLQLVFRYSDRWFFDGGSCAVYKVGIAVCIAWRWCVAAFASILLGGDHSDRTHSILAAYRIGGGIGGCMGNVVKRLHDLDEFDQWYCVAIPGWQKWYYVGSLVFF